MLSSAFNQKLNRLLTDLQRTNSWFIKCLNPNKNKSAIDWDDKHIRKQLAANGIIEAIKVIKLGYPSRTDHQFILDKFSKNISKYIQDFYELNQRLQIQCILCGLNINSNEYELGFTSFFKPNSRNILIDIQNHSEYLMINKLKN